MSSRNFRKLCPHTLPPPDSDSDGDYQPLYTRQPNNRSTYEGLEVSSHSDSEREPEAEKEDSKSESTAHGGARKKTIQKKKKKGKKQKGAKVQTNGSGSSKRLDEMDEIDKSVMEVNALLGAPPPAPPPPKPRTELEKMGDIMVAHPRHLNVTYELRRLFGPDDPEEIKQRNKTQPHRARVLKRVLVYPTNDTKIYNFRRTGLSMSIQKREGDLTFFAYDHDEDYQKRHRTFLLKFIRNHKRMTTAGLMFSEEARTNMHVEALLEIADSLFRLDEHGLANEIVENTVTYLQSVAHPSFNLASMKVRLSFQILENRPFHVAMFRYMYLLSNKACHRTALEIAKMLLNIDPNDPLAVLFVIDTLALRAREHQWLIDAIEYLNRQRQAKLLFNIQYSYALAHYHVAKKTKKDFTEADRHLKCAIMACPPVVLSILLSANISEPRIRIPAIFNREPRPNATGGLSDLILIYAKLTWPRWREPGVIDWFIRNAIEVSENYDNDVAVRERVEELMAMRLNLFQQWPTEILRHVNIIRGMSNLLMDMNMGPPHRNTSGWDPLLDRGINRYAYPVLTDPPRYTSNSGHAMLYRFFSSMLPSHDLDPPVDE